MHDLCMTLVNNDIIAISRNSILECLAHISSHKQYVFNKLQQMTSLFTKLLILISLQVALYSRTLCSVAFLSTEVSHTDSHGVFTNACLPAFAGNEKKKKKERKPKRSTKRSHREAIEKKEKVNKAHSKENALVRAAVLAC